MSELTPKIVLTVTAELGELSGELTRHTIMHITKKSMQQLFLPSSTILDLMSITRIDTAGLAWLFYLLEQASLANCQLSFANIPAKLDKLISLSGVEGFLPVKE